MSILLRPLTADDLPRVLQIERLAQFAPWEEAVFIRCMEIHCAEWGVFQDETCVGFIIFSLQFNESHILNLCVHPDYQRQGFGKLLISKALNLSAEFKTKMIYLEVRRSNQAAIALYEQQGFVQIGERKQYYPAPNQREDALVFAKELISPIED